MCYSSNILQNIPSQMEKIPTMLSRCSLYPETVGNDDIPSKPAPACLTSTKPHKLVCRQLTTRPSRYISANTHFLVPHTSKHTLVSETTRIGPRPLAASRGSLVRVAGYALDKTDLQIHFRETGNECRLNVFVCSCGKGRRILMYA